MRFLIPKIAAINCTKPQLLDFIYNPEPSSGSRIYICAIKFAFILGDETVETVLYIVIVNTTLGVTGRHCLRTKWSTNFYENGSPQHHIALYQ